MLFLNLDSWLLQIYNFVKFLPIYNLYLYQSKLSNNLLMFFGYNYLFFWYFDQFLDGLECIQSALLLVQVLYFIYLYFYLRFYFLWNDQPVQLFYYYCYCCFHYYYYYYYYYYYWGYFSSVAYIFFWWKVFNIYYLHFYLWFCHYF